MWGAPVALYRYQPPTLTIDQAVTVGGYPIYRSRPRFAEQTAELSSSHDYWGLAVAGLICRTLDEAVKSDTLSYPPRGLSREEAARYVGVGITKFDQMVADRRMPKPKKVDGRVIWDRLKLEAAFGELPGDDEENIVDFLLQGNHRRE